MREVSSSDTHGEGARPEVARSIDFSLEKCSPAYLKDARYFPHPQLDKVLARIEARQNELLPKLREQWRETAAPKWATLSDAELFNWAYIGALGNPLSATPPRVREVEKEILARIAKKTWTLGRTPPTKEDNSILRIDWMKLLNDPPYIEQAVVTLFKRANVTSKTLGRGLERWRALAQSSSLDQLLNQPLSYIELTLLKEQLLYQFDEESLLRLQDESQGLPKNKKLPYEFSAPRRLTTDERRDQYRQERIRACIPSSQASAKAAELQSFVSRYHGKRGAPIHGLPQDLRDRVARWSGETQKEFERLFDSFRSQSKDQEVNLEPHLVRLLYQAVNDTEFNNIRKARALTLKGKKGEDANFLKQANEQKADRAEAIDTIAFLAALNGRPLTDREKEYLANAPLAEFERTRAIITELAGKPPDYRVTPADKAIGYFQKGIDRLRGVKAENQAVIQALVLPQNGSGLYVDPAKMKSFSLPSLISTNPEHAVWAMDQNKRILDYYAPAFGENRPPHLRSRAQLYKFFDDAHEQTYAYRLSDRFCFGKKCTEADLAKPASREELDLAYRLVKMKQLEQEFPEIELNENTQPARLAHEAALIKAKVEKERKHEEECRAAVTGTCSVDPFVESVNARKERNRRLWRALEFERNTWKGGEELLRSDNNRDERAIQLANNMHHGIGELQRELEKDLYDEHQPSSQAEAALGEKVDVEFPCDPLRMKLPPDIKYRSKIVFRGVPKEVLQSSELFNGWVQKHLMELSEAKENQRNGGPLSLEKQRELVESRLLPMVRSYSLASGGRYPSYAWHRVLCLDWEGGTKGYSFAEALGSLLRLNPQINEDNPMLASKRRNDYRDYPYIDATKELSKAFDLNDSTRKYQIKIFSPDPQLEELTRGIQKIVNSSATDKAQQIAAKLAPLKKPRASAEEKKRLRDTIAVFRNFPPGNTARQIVLGEEGVPDHIRKHLRQDPDFAKMYYSTSPEFRSRQHALADMGLIPDEQNKGHLVDQMKADLRLIHEKRDLPNPDQEAERLVSKNKEALQTDKVFIDRTNTTFLARLLKAKTNVEADAILLDPNLEFADVETLATTEYEKHGAVIKLEDAKSYYFFELLKLRQHLIDPSKKLELDPKLYNLVSNGKTKPTDSQLTRLGRGIERVILEIDKRLRYGHSDVIDAAFHTLPSEQALALELLQMERHLKEQGKTPTQYQREFELNNLRSMNSRVDRLWRKSAAEMSPHLQGLARHANWYLYDHRPDSLDNGVVPGREKAAPKPEQKVSYFGLSSDSASALNNLPPALYDIVDHLTRSGYSPGFEGAQRSSRVVSTNDNGPTPSTHDPALAKRLEKILHNPWPTDILNLVVTNRDARLLYGNHVKDKMEIRSYELQGPKSKEVIPGERDVINVLLGKDQKASTGTPFTIVNHEGFNGFLAALPNLNSEQREAFREWALKNLVKYGDAAAVAVSSKFDLNQFIAETKQRLEGKRGKGVEKFDNELTPQLLALMVSLIDESGDPNGGHAASALEGHKGGDFRFDPRFAAVMANRELALRHNIPVYSGKDPSTGALASALTELSLDHKGMNTTRRIELLAMPQDKLEELGRLTKQLAREAGQPGSNIRAKISDLLQQTDQDEISVARDLFTEHDKRWDDLNAVEIPKYEEQIRNRIRMGQALNDRDKELLGFLAQERTQREWLPNQMRESLMNGGPSDQTAVAKIQLGMAMQVAADSAQIFKELSEEVAQERMAQHLKKLSNGKKSPDVVQEEMQILLSQLGSSEKDAKRLAKVDPIAAKLLSNPENVKFLKDMTRILNIRLGDRVTRELMSESLEEPAQAVLDEVLPKFTNRLSKIPAENEGLVAPVTKAWYDAKKELAKTHSQEAIAEVDELFNRKALAITDAASNEAHGIQSRERYKAEYTPESQNFAKLADETWKAWEARDPDGELTNKEVIEAAKAFEKQQRCEGDEFLDRLTKIRMEIEDLLIRKTTMNQRKFASIDAMNSEEWTKKKDGQPIYTPEDKEMMKASLARLEKDLADVERRLGAAYQRFRDTDQELEKERERWRQQATELNEKIDTARTETPLADIGSTPFRTFIKESADASVPELGMQGAIAESRAVELGRYFQWRTKAEAFARTLGNPHTASSLEQDPRYLPLLRSAQSGEMGFQLSKAEVDRVLQQAQRKISSEYRTRSRTLGSMSGYGIKWDGVSVDFSRLSSNNGKIPTHEELKKALTEFGTVQRDRSGIGKTPWEQLEAAILMKWNGEGRPPMMEWDDESNLAIEVIRPKERCGEYQFVFHDLSEMRANALSASESAESIRSHLPETLKGMRAANNHFIQIAYDPTAEKGLGYDVANYQLQIDRLRKLGNVKVVKKGDITGHTAQRTSTFYDIERKTGVLTDIDQNFKNIESDMRWRAVEQGAIVATLALSAGTSAGWMGAVFAGMRTGAILSTMSGVLQQDLAPAAFGKPSEQYFSDIGPGALTNIAVFGASGGLGRLMTAAMKANQIKTLSSGSGALPWMSRAIGRDGSINMLSLMGSSFATGMGRQLYTDYVHGYDVDLWSSFQQEALAAGQNAFFVWAPDQKIAGRLAKNFLGRFLLSLGVNQSISAAMTGYQVRGQRSQIDEQLKLVEGQIEERKRKEEDVSGLEARKKQLQDMKARLGYLDTIVHHNFAELGAHAFFARNAANHGWMHGVQRDLLKLTTPGYKGKLTFEGIQENTRKQMKRQIRIPGFDQLVGERHETDANMFIQRTILNMRYPELMQLQDAAAKSPHLKDANATPNDAFKAFELLSQRTGMKPERIVSALKERSNSGKERYRLHPNRNLSDPTELVTLRSLASRQIQRELKQASRDGDLNRVMALTAELSMYDPKSYRRIPLPDVASAFKLRDANGNFAQARGEIHAQLEQAKEQGNVEKIRELQDQMNLLDHMENARTIAGAAAADLGVSPSAMFEFLERYKAPKGRVMDWTRATQEFVKTLPLSVESQKKMIADGKLTLEDFDEIYPNTGVYQRLAASRAKDIFSQRNVNMDPAKFAERLVALRKSDPTLTFDKYLSSQTFPSRN